MNLANQPVRKVSKESQVNYKRGKPTAKQRGAISVKVRKELRERSNGICECCRYNLAAEAAHTLRRWRIEDRTTVNDLAHLCHDCHRWADNTQAGRKWLEEFRNKRLEESA